MQKITRNSPIVAAAVITLVGVSPLYASVSVDNGTATPNIWSEANNWNPNGVPTTADDVIFDDSLTTLSGVIFALGTDGTVHPTSAFTANSLTFGPALGAFTLQTNAIGPNFDRSLALTTGAITVDATATATKTILSTNGVLTLSATDNSYEFANNSAAGGLTIGAVLGDGPGATSLTTTGNMTLSGANTYTGATNINSGILRITNTAGLTSTSAINIASGATLDVGVTAGDLSKLVAGGGVGVGKTLRFSVSQAGATSGPGTILGTLETQGTIGAPVYAITMGAGSKFTNPINTTNYGGALVIDGNTTFEQGASGTVSATGTIDSNTAGDKIITLTGNGTGNNILSGVISNSAGTIGFLKTGTNSFQFGPNSNSSNNTFSGGITVREGSLVIGGLTSAGDITKTINVGDTVDGATGPAYISRTNHNSTLSNPITFTAGSTNSEVGIVHLGTTGRVFGGLITADRDIVLRVNGSAGHSFTGGLALGANTLNVDIQANGSFVIGSVITASPGAKINIDGNASGGGSLGFSTAGQGLAGLDVPITITSGRLELTASGGAGNGTEFGNGIVTVKAGGAVTPTVVLRNAGLNPISTPKYVVESNATLQFQTADTSARQQRFGAVDLGSAGTGATLNLVQTGASSPLQDLGLVTLGGNSTIYVHTTNGASQANAGQGITGAYSLTKTGTRPLVVGASTLSSGSIPARAGASSDYTGDTTISAGSIRVGRDDALPTGTKVLIASGATLDLSVNGTSLTTANFNQTIAGLEDVVSGAGGSTVTANSSTSNLAAAKTLTVGGAGSYSFSGTLANNTGTGSGLLSLAKAGTGTQELTGASTYSGGTNVTQGKLLVNNVSGSGTGSGAVVVDGASAVDFGTLGGKGSIDGAVTVQGYGQLSPGNSPGVLTVAGGLTFDANTSFVVEIDGTAGAGLTGGHDQVALTGGSATLAGTLNAAFGTFAADGSEVFYIINNTGSGTSGTFQFADDAIVATANGYDWRITYDADLGGGDALNGGNDVALYATEIPEPASLGVLAMAAMTVLRRRRAC